MAKQGFYGREYIPLKNGDYDYQGQVNRLHNLKEWDRDETLTIGQSSTVSLDEMNERWKAYDWLVADDKHWEAKVIKKVDEDAWKKRREKTRINYKELNSKPLEFSLISRIAHCENW